MSRRGGARKPRGEPALERVIPMVRCRMGSGDRGLYYRGLFPAPRINTRLINRAIAAQPASNDALARSVSVADLRADRPGTGRLSTDKVIEHDRYPASRQARHPVDEDGSRPPAFQQGAGGDLTCRPDRSVHGQRPAGLTRPGVDLKKSLSVAEDSRIRQTPPASVRVSA
jgi:hypothetical protein